MSDTPPPFDASQFVSTRSLSALQPFDLAKLARDSAALIANNAVLVLVLSFCLVTLPKLAVIGTHLYFHGTRGDEDTAYDVLNSIDNGLDIGAGIVLQIVLTWAVVRRSQRLDLALGSFFSVLIPFVILAILLTIGTTLGIALFIIPGLILFVRWSVAWSVVAAESKSALDAMGRSAELVKGYGWPIFAALLVCYVFQWLFETGIELLGETMLGIWPDNHIDWIISALAAPVGLLPIIAVSIALYFQVVALKEGGTDAGIAEAFD